MKLSLQGCFHEITGKAGWTANCVRFHTRASVSGAVSRGYKQQGKNGNRTAIADLFAVLLNYSART